MIACHVSPCWESVVGESVSHSTAFFSMGHNLGVDHSDTVGQYYVHMHAQEATLYTGCDSQLVTNVVFFHRISNMIIFSEICDYSGRCV